LRAIFGAHPVDINESGVKRFASWPTTGIYTDYNFTVILYSSKKGDEDIRTGCNISELNEYANSRYLYLNHLKNVLENHYELYQKEMRGKLINKGNDELVQLEILQNECKIRLDNDYYKSNIENLITMFSVKNIDERNIVIVEDYLKVLKQGIGELYAKLSDMSFDTLESDDSINPIYPSENLYSFEKFYGYVYLGKNSEIKSWFIKDIKDLVSGFVVIEENMDRDELLLYVNAGLYFMSKL
jgi:hypothetical protein